MCTTHTIVCKNFFETVSQEHSSAPQLLWGLVTAETLFCKQILERFIKLLFAESSSKVDNLRKMFELMEKSL